ncbi:MAG: hypothetical protein PVH95_10730, partial [Anaerolineae bacterium]
MTGHESNEKAGEGQGSRLDRFRSPAGQRQSLPSEQGNFPSPEGGSNSGFRQVETSRQAAPGGHASRPPNNQPSPSRQVYVPPPPSFDPE